MLRESYYIMRFIEEFKNSFKLRYLLKAVIDNKKIVFSVFVSFIVSLIISYLLIYKIPEFSYIGNLIFENFKSNIQSSNIVLNQSPEEITLFIWMNNLKVCVISYILGFLGLFILVVNSYLIAYVIYKFGLKSLILILPHGVIEIPALILGISSGIILYIGIIKLLFKKPAKKEFIDSFRLFILAVLLFIIAGFVEGFITFKIAKII